MFEGDDIGTTDEDSQSADAVDVNDAVDVDDTGVLAPGTGIEVRNKLDGRWSKGFAVHSRVDGGYRIIRVSDGSVLPTLFEDDQIREHSVTRKNDSWWF